MIGIWTKFLSSLIALAVSKPSILGITASINIRAGIKRLIKASAPAPSAATSVVIPAFSRTADNMPSVSGDSSTASMTGFFGQSGGMAHHCLDGGTIPVQVAIFREPAQKRQAWRGMRLCADGFVQFCQDA